MLLLVVNSEELMLVLIVSTDGILNQILAMSFVYAKGWTIIYFFLHMTFDYKEFRSHSSH